MFKSSMIKMTHGSSDIDNSLGGLLPLRAEGGTRPYYWRSADFLTG
jgi:hypothetical protein